MIMDNRGIVSLDRAGECLRRRVRYKLRKVLLIRLCVSFPAAQKESSVCFYVFDLAKKQERKESLCRLFISESI